MLQFPNDTINIDINIIFLASRMSVGISILIPIKFSWPLLNKMLI